MIDKIKKEVNSWFVADANGFTNRKGFVIFAAIVTLPLVIFEGIKIGIYDKYSPANIGLTNMMEGLFIPFYKVMRLKEENSFGQKMGTIDFSYVLLLFLVWGFIFLSVFVKVEMREKVKKHTHKRIWGDSEAFNKKLAYPVEKPEVREPDRNNPKEMNDTGNMILTEKTRYCLSGTSNTYSCSLIVGSIGTGKSFTYVKPNILQMNSSYVVTDPSGELAQSLGTTLMEHGYDVKVFNLSEQQYSCKYNPFAYIKDRKDVIITVNAFLNATTEGDTSGDPFFPIAEKNFYYALFYYVYTMLPKEEQTFKSVYELYASADEVETFGQQKGEILEAEFDRKFRECAEMDATNPCLSFYKTFKKGSPKTKQSILISAGVKLWFMSVPTVANLLSADTLHLETMGDRRSALFVIIPTDDSSFKCISAMLFTQLFQTLYYVGGILNPQTYQLRYGPCIVARSKPFIKGTPSEQEAKEEMILRKAWYTNAFVQDDNELMEHDPVLKEKYTTVNELGIIPWPMSRIVVPVEDLGESVSELQSLEKTSDGKYYILEEFKSKQAAEMVLNAAKNGEVKQGVIKHASHVRFMLDEFYNIGKIEGFDNKIATFRKYGISADIIVQSLSQLNMMYDDHPEVITGCCDIKICLGVNTMEDAEAFEKMCGETSIDKENKNYDAKNSIVGTATNGGGIQEDTMNLINASDLMGKGMDTKVICVVRTQDPIKDNKYKAISHPRWKETYSDRDPATFDREFQYRRIFFIEQDDKNLIRTVIDNPNAQVAAQNNQNNKTPLRNSIVKQGKDPATVDMSQKKIMDKRKREVGVVSSAKQKFEAFIDNKRNKKFDNTKIDNITKYADENVNNNIPLFMLPNEVIDVMAAGISNNTWEYNEETNFVSKIENDSNETQENVNNFDTLNGVIEDPINMWDDDTVTISEKKNNESNTNDSTSESNNNSSGNGGLDLNNDTIADMFYDI